MILPSSADFFYTPSSTLKKSVETSNISTPLTHLAAKVVFHYLGLQTRQRIAQTGSAHLRLLNDEAPHKIRSLSIGSNVIEFDFYGAAYTFTGGNQVTIRTFGGVKKEATEFQGSQEEFMKSILGFYLNRRDTIVTKMYLQDQKAFRLLKEIGIMKKFQIKSSDDLLMRDFMEDIGRMPDAILRRIEWSLVDKRPR